MIVGQAEGEVTVVRDLGREPSPTLGAVRLEVGAPGIDDACRAVGTDPLDGERDRQRSTVPAIAAPETRKSRDIGREASYGRRQREIIRQQHACVSVREESAQSPSAVSPANMTAPTAAPIHPSLKRTGCA